MLLYLWIDVISYFYQPQHPIKGEICFAKGEKKQEATRRKQG